MIRALEMEWIVETYRTVRMLSKYHIWNALYMSDEESMGCTIYSGVYGTCKYVCDPGDQKMYGMGECKGRICCYWKSKQTFVILKTVFIKTSTRGKWKILKNSNALCLFMYIRYLKDTCSSLFGILKNTLFSGKQPHFKVDFTIPNVDEF